MGTEEATDILQGELRRPELKWRKLEDNADAQPPDIL
jgi:hypothetical protein